MSYWSQIFYLLGSVTEIYPWFSGDICEINIETIRGFVYEWRFPIKVFTTEYTSSPFIGVSEMLILQRESYQSIDLGAETLLTVILKIKISIRPGI